MSGLTPANWIMVRADAVCDKIQDGTHFSPKVQLSAGEYPYVTAKNVRPSGLDLSDLTYLRPEDHAQIFSRADVRQGDVLLVKDGVNAGDAAINTVAGEISLLSSVCFLRPRGDVLSAGFLRYFLQSPRGNGALTGKLTGTAIRRIILQRVRELAVPVAPMAEQHRIVEAIESYLTRLDNAVALLERAEENLKRYRASVLKAAVEGRLVPTEAALACQEGRAYEPASDLLQRILAERKTRWIEANKGRARQYNAPASPDTTELSELPEGWCWASVEQLSSEIRYGYTASAVDGSAGPRFLRITDIQDGHVDWSTVPTCEIAPDEVRSYELVPGDLVFARTGATTGKSYLIGEVPKAVFASYLIRMRFLAGAEADYAYLFFQSGAYWRQISAAKKGTGQPGVNATTLSGLCVPLPPEPEQRRIAQAAWSLVTRSENVAATAAEQIRRAARLRQSVLKWAFEGKLVEQDPNDEPASVLLERITADRAAAATSKARGRQKRSAQ